MLWQKRLNNKGKMTSSEKKTIEWNDFAKIEMRIGTVVSCVIFEEVKNPAYKMHIDFGAFGIRKTSAQVTKLYKPEDLKGKQVVAVLNFPPKQIANIMSECLILGAIGDDKAVTLLVPEREIENGTKVG